MSLCKTFTDIIQKACSYPQTCSKPIECGNNVVMYCSNEEGHDGECSAKRSLKEKLYDFRHTK